MTDKLDAPTKKDADAVAAGATANFHRELNGDANGSRKITPAGLSPDGAAPPPTGKELPAAVDFNSHPDIFVAAIAGRDVADLPKPAGMASAAAKDGASMAAGGDGPGLKTGGSEVKLRGVGLVDEKGDPAGGESNIRERGMQGTGAEQPKDLAKTAEEARSHLDQLNPEDKAKLSADQLAKLKKLESSVLGGDLKGAQSVLDSMSKQSEPSADDPSKPGEDNAALKAVFVKDMKAAGISADFSTTSAPNIPGSPYAHGMDVSLHLSDHFPENTDQFYNHSFTNVNLSSTPGAGFADQSIPSQTPGWTISPDYKGNSQSEALGRLGEQAQQNLGVLPPPTGQPERTRQ